VNEKKEKKMAEPFETPPTETSESKLGFAVIAALCSLLPNKWKWRKFVVGILTAMSLYIWDTFLAAKYSTTVDPRSCDSKDFKDLVNVMTNDRRERAKFHGVAVKRIEGGWGAADTYILVSNSKQKLAKALKECAYRYQSKPPISGDCIRIKYKVGCESKERNDPKALYSPEKLFLKEGVLEKIFDTVDSMFAGMDGIHTAFGSNSFHLMFHGPCRVGKSSIALAIAAKYNLNVTRLTPQGFVGSERDTCFTLPDRNDLFIIDEFDVFLDVLRQSERSSTALLMFQQLIENSFNSQRCMLVYTTNNIEKIEKRFVERCALIQEISYFDRDQTKKFLAAHGLPNCDYFVEQGNARLYEEYARLRLAAAGKKS